MRKVLMAVLALMLTLGGSASLVTAQETATPEVPAAGDAPVASDPDLSATYFTDRGAPIATLTIVDVERGWQEYSDRDVPSPGVEYVAVTFEVAVVSRGALEVKPNDFSMIDGIGRNNDRSRVRIAEESDAQLFEDAAAVASEEVGEFTLVFEAYEDTSLGYFMWQPERNVVVLVDLGEA